MLSIGQVKLDNPYILAPMAGISDPPFRRLCKKGGAGMVCAEMVSANALFFNSKKSLHMLSTYEDEHPVSMQVFGCDPKRLALSAKKAEESGADVIDLNSGCPVAKIYKTGAGISLMKNESLFSQCVETMVKAVRVPVTVKMRLGFQKQHNLSKRFGQLAESAGASAVVVHARYMDDHHAGPPDLEALSDTVATLRVPVIGNGGVSVHHDVSHMMSKTHCAGVMIGQAAIGNPFIFDEINDAPQNTGNKMKQKKMARRFELFKDHAKMMVAFYGEELGIKRFRKFISSYVKGVPAAAEFRDKACRVTVLSELYKLINTLAARQDHATMSKCHLTE